MPGRQSSHSRSRGRLDIDDDRMFEVDQVVGAVGEEGSLVRRGGEERGRIRWRFFEKVE